MKSLTSPAMVQLSFFESLEGNDIPRRITYPVIEQSLNPKGYEAAKTRMGGDEMAIEDGWDK